MGSWAPWALVSIAAVALLYRGLLAERQTVDDLFIYLRYARALAERGEMAFNPGEHVEGASSVVWTWALAAAWGGGLRGVGVAKLASWGVMGAIPVASALAVPRRRRLAIAIPACALALDADLAAWGPSGMDTPLFALACVACVALVAADRPRAAAVALGLLAWIRPEGPLVTAVGALALVLAGRRSIRSSLTLLALAAAPVVALVALRAIYFHDVVPNTFYAKMRAVDGRDFTGGGYLLSAVARRPMLLGAVVLLPIVTAIRWRRGALPEMRGREAEVALVAWAMALSVAVFVLVAGGDWMPNRRLLVPALPLSAIALAAYLPAVTRVAPSLLALALFAEGAASTSRALDQRWRTREYLDERLASARVTGRPFRDPYPLDWMPTHFLRELAPFVGPGGTVAHGDVGQLPYVMRDVSFLDAFGLVDRAAGKLTFFRDDPALRDAVVRDFFTRSPEVALVVLDEATGRPFSPAQIEYVQDARFAARYRELARIPTWGGHPCVTFVRRDVTPVDAAVADARVRSWLDAVPDVRAAFE